MKHLDAPKIFDEEINVHTSPRILMVAWKHGGSTIPLALSGSAHQPVVLTVKDLL